MYAISFLNFHQNTGIELKTSSDPLEIKIRSNPGFRILLYYKKITAEQIDALSENQSRVLRGAAIANQIVADKKDLSEFLLQRVEDEDDDLGVTGLCGILGYQISVNYDGRVILLNNDLHITRFSVESTIADEEKLIGHNTVYVQVEEEKNTPINLKCRFKSRADEIKEVNIAWKDLPKNFPVNAKKIKDYSQVILKELKLTPELQFEAQFERRRAELGKNFTLEDQNFLFEQFNKKLLVHRHSWFDKVGIENTGAFRLVIDKMRKKAFEELNGEIQKIMTGTPGDYERGATLLEKAREMPLFNSHQNNFWFTGAFGRTATVGKIDDLLDIMRIYRDTPQHEYHI